MLKGAQSKKKNTVWATSPFLWVRFSVLPSIPMGSILMHKPHFHFKLKMFHENFSCESACIYPN